MACVLIEVLLPKLETDRLQGLQIPEQLLQPADSQGDNCKLAFLLHRLGGMQADQDILDILTGCPVRLPVSRNVVYLLKLPGTQQQIQRQVMAYGVFLERQSTTGQQVLIAELFANFFVTLKTLHKVNLKDNKEYVVLYENQQTCQQVTGIYFSACMSCYIKVSRRIS